MIDTITGLDQTRWERARAQAIEQVKNLLTPPNEKLYVLRGNGKHPRWLEVAAMVLLAIVGGGAFWLSAGKQIAATDLALAPVVADYRRLSSMWQDMGIVLNLSFGELGTILFFLAAGLYPGPVSRVARRYNVAWFSFIFRLMGGLCACFAIIANVSITALHPISSIPVYNWFLTLAAPGAVLGIGLLAERMVLSSLEAREAARRAYEKAYGAYLRYQENPETHPKFKEFWHRAIIDQIGKVSAVNRHKLDEAVTLDPGVRALLIHREFNRNEWATSIEIEPTRPTQPSLPMAAGGAEPDPLVLPLPALPS
jgi:hypothetical protein